MQKQNEAFDDSHGEKDAGSLRLGLAGKGDLRWAVADIGRPMEALRRRLDPSPVAAIALGRSLAAAALLLRFSTKYPGRLRFEVRGDGPLGPIQAEVNSAGDMRAILGELQFPGVEGDELNVGRAVGKGLLQITQETVRRPDPWLSQTQLVSGEIGDDVVHFLHQSQQIQSAALLTAKPGPQGILAAGGLLVEALPGAEESRIARLESNITALPDLGALMHEQGIDGMLSQVFAGLDIEDLEQHELRYRCPCSRDSLLKRLLTLPAEQLQDIADEQGKAVVECAFCLSQYVFSVDDLRVN